MGHPEISRDSPVESGCHGRPVHWYAGFTILVLCVTFITSFNFIFQSDVETAYANLHRTVKCVSTSWNSTGFKTGRNTRLFLRLNDFIWRYIPSSLPLPYGTEHSQDTLKMILSAMSSFDMPENSNRLDCRSCVVVGNGYGIKGTSLGDTINHYDVVIRINDAPVRGFEKDVGNKTTMRFFYPESASQNPSVDNEADTLMVVIPFKPMDLIWLRNILFDEKRSRKGFWKSPPLMWLANRSNLRILDPFFMRNTAAQLLRARFRSKTKDFSLRPTTGILAIYVALNYCDMVHVAGFGYPPIQNLTAPTHYFGKTVMKSMKNSGHDVSYEAKALKRLEDSGAIVYLHPH
ncbi:CMP-N-acetylneuraminate-beta-galactosamide-alpha-2,3-sialyltransferase 4-like isoform X1 [Brienomyrus brachyistius]|uniref:CMP-N-acetylneuraminate-beta-galactosamide- alpha-2,3-sialyltransferase 4-like isoform X1 n=1 Tax=Brienomyrus brachyistius TaxID=42636 RepID=UPI0020B211C2|nr:CMP-N-acetylneuraminate-beta-galactosamide-alpha-2,3-sialyltransferase 4-like isoform X1 [Brienomyrus brachyistius]